MRFGRNRLQLAFTILWLAFTVSFAIWWFKLSIDNIGDLARLDPTRSHEWERQRRMIFWEGSAWVVLLALGGGALIGLAQRERRRVTQIREFFASFSHEIKTSLASLRLQAEALQDDLGQQTSPILGRLIGDTVRLQVQLENSLFFASQDGLQLYIQPVDFATLVERAREQWPNLEIQLEGRAKVQGDERALRAILGNLVQNAFVHGRARKIEVQVRKVEGGRVEIRVQDDGKGFQGDLSRLGEVFHRPTSTSGSGLGLYICRILLDRMGGGIQLEPATKGFAAVLTLNGEVV